MFSSDAWTSQDIVDLLSLRWNDNPHQPISLASKYELDQNTEWGRCEPLLFDATKDLDLSSEVAALWRERYLYSALQYRINIKQLASVLRILGNTDVVVLKGMALASAVYPEAALRPVLDIDLLVRPEDAEFCTIILEENQYSRVDAEESTNSILSYENELLLIQGVPPNTKLELHWHLFDSPYHQHRIDQAWLWQTTQTITANDSRLRILGTEAQLLHLCGHLALHHPIPSDRDMTSHLLWLVDIGEVIYRYGDDLDWNVVLEKAQEYDLVLSLQSVIGHVRKLWPFLIPDNIWGRIESLHPTMGERRVYKWLTAENQSVLQRFISDLAMMPTWSVRTRYTWQSMFPSTEYMQWRYDIDKPWPVPAYYPYRWWIGLKGLWQKDR